jgi:hypothetical protein
MNRDGSTQRIHELSESLVKTQRNCRFDNFEDCIRVHPRQANVSQAPSVQYLSNHRALRFEDALAVVVRRN